MDVYRLIEPDKYSFINGARQGLRVSHPDENTKYTYVCDPLRASDFLDKLSALGRWDKVRALENHFDDAQAWAASIPSRKLYPTTPRGFIAANFVARHGRHALPKEPIRYLFQSPEEHALALRFEMLRGDAEVDSPTRLWSVPSAAEIRPRDGETLDYVTLSRRALYLGLSAALKVNGRKGGERLYVWDPTYSLPKAVLEDLILTVTEDVHGVSVKSVPGVWETKAPPRLAEGNSISHKSRPYWESYNLGAWQKRHPDRWDVWYRIQKEYG